MNKSAAIAKFFKDEVDEKSYYVIPKDIEEQRDVSKTVIRNAINTMVSMGYRLYYVQTDPKKATSVGKILVPSGTTYHSIIERKDEIFKD